MHAESAGAGLRLQPDGRSGWAHTHAVAENLCFGDGRHQCGAAFEDGGRGGGTNLEILVALLGGAAEQDRVVAWHDVGHPARIGLVEHPLLEADLLDNHDLAADRQERCVVIELAGTESGAVHDGIDAIGCRVQAPADRPEQAETSAW
jgi:hypothetical protein